LKHPAALPDLAPALSDAEPSALRRFIEDYVRLCEAAPESIEGGKAGAYRVREGMAPAALQPLLERAKADAALARRVEALLPRLVEPG
jgi:hypothetical protein